MPLPPETHDGNRRNGKQTLATPLGPFWAPLLLPCERLSRGREKQGERLRRAEFAMMANHRLFCALQDRKSAESFARSPQALIA